VAEDLKAGFARYGGGRIPASYLPKKIDIDVPGGEMAQSRPVPSGYIVNDLPDDCSWPVNRYTQSVGA
jgi:hypothetical protein